MEIHVFLVLNIVLVVHHKFSVLLVYHPLSLIILVTEHVNQIVNLINTLEQLVFHPIKEIHQQIKLLIHKQQEEINQQEEEIQV